MGVAALILAAAPAIRADQPITSSVRYTREVAGILDRKCLPCHARGSLSVPLTSYQEVRAWGRAIREEILEQRMPPWPAAPGYGHFRNDLSLTARERATLLSWIDGGMPRGDGAAPRPAGIDDAGDAPPGRRLAVPAQTIPAGGDLVVRRVVVATDLPSPRWVRRVVVRPGDRRVARGALVFVEPQGLWVGAWLPWQASIEPPEGHAFLLPARARLTLVLYYRGADEPVVDRPVVELYFAPSARRRTVGQLVVETSVNLEKPATVWALQPSPSPTARSLELRVRRPNGAIQVLLWMPRCLPEWPQALVLQQPAELPAGTTVSLIVHDQSEATSRVILSAIQ